MTAITIIANVAVCPFPIEVLPVIYRYGYAMPFYNVSRGIRTVLFATRNRGEIFILSQLCQAQESVDQLASPLEF